VLGIFGLAIPLSEGHLRFILKFWACTSFPIRGCSITARVLSRLRQQ
jgi:hypothetical protein